MTHNAKVLQLLADGRPHSHHELYGLHVIAHSRVSDLRRMGHFIEQWKENGDYWYQLIRDTGAVGEWAVSSSAVHRGELERAPVTPGTVREGDEGQTAHGTVSGSPSPRGPSRHPAVPSLPQGEVCPPEPAASLSLPLASPAPPKQLNVFEGMAA